jgi:hypothetical protein
LTKGASKASVGCRQSAKNNLNQRWSVFMPNPLRDYFSSAIGPLQDFAVLETTTTKIDAAAGANALTVDGVPHNTTDRFKIIIKPDGRIFPQADRVWFVVFDYDLTDVVWCEVYDGSTSVTLPCLPQQLTARAKTWKWLKNAHTTSVAMCVPDIDAAGADELTISIRLHVSPHITGTSATDLTLSTFRLYSVAVPKLELEVRSSVAPFSPWPLGGLTFLAVATHSYELPGSVAGTGAIVPHTTTLSVSAASGAAKAIFRGTVNAAPTLTGKEIYASLVAPLAAFDLPAIASGKIPSQVSQVLSLIDYLALLDAYDVPKDRLLSLEEALLLDATSKLLFPVPISTPPIPLPVVKRKYHFLAHLPNWQGTQTQFVGGPAGVNLPLQYRMAQELGQSAIIANMFNIELKSRCTDALRYGIDLFHLVFDSMRYHDVSAAGPLSQPSETSPVGKNPLQLDVRNFARGGRDFAVGYQSASQAVEYGAKFIYHTPEIGDTWVGHSFVPSGTNADTDIASLNSYMASRPNHYYYITRDGDTVFLPNFALKSDMQYQAGFQFYFLDENSREEIQLKKFKHNFPRFMSNLNDDSDDGISVRKNASKMVGGNESAMVFPDDDVSSTNGSRDTFPIGIEGYYKPRLIEYRMPKPGSNAVERLKWYKAMRYWNKANADYLATATAMMQRHASTPNFIHTSNVSRRLGYFDGYETHTVFSSGALDIVWMHDFSTRFTGYPQNHLLVCNVFCDLAAATSRIPPPGKERMNPKRPIAAYLQSDRPDFKAMIWASRGATQFEVYSATSLYWFGDGYYGTGDVPLQFLAQTRRASEILTKAQDWIEGCVRPRARVALVVPQSDTAWDLRNSKPESPGSTRPEGLGGGFEQGHVLNKQLYGLHALFTHAHISVDFVFEEDIANDPASLHNYSIVVSTAKLLHDQAFASIAANVELEGCIYVGCGGYFYPTRLLSLGAIFNEYFEERPNRTAWYGVTSSPDYGNHHKIKRGNGYVIIPGEASVGAMVEEQLIGERYLDSIDVKSWHFVYPGWDRPAGAPDLLAKAKEAWSLLETIEQALTDLSGGRQTLRSLSTCWVETPAGEPEPMVEAVLHEKFVGGKRQGVIFLIDHRQRDYDIALTDGRESPVGERQRVSRPVTVHVAPGFGNIVASDVAVDPARNPMPLPAGASFEINLVDYEIVRWEAA